MLIVKVNVCLILSGDEDANIIMILCVYQGVAKSCCNSYLQFDIMLCGAYIVCLITNMIDQDNQQPNHFCEEWGQPMAPGNHQVAPFPCWLFRNSRLCVRYAINESVISVYCWSGMMMRICQNRSKHLWLDTSHEPLSKEMEQNVTIFSVLSIFKTPKIYNKILFQNLQQDH